MESKKNCNLYYNEKFRMKENNYLSNNSFSLYIKKINFDTPFPKKGFININQSPDNTSKKKSFSKSQNPKYLLSSPTFESNPISYNSMSLPLKIEKFYISKQGKIKNKIIENYEQNKFFIDKEIKAKVLKNISNSSLSLNKKVLKNNISLQKIDNNINKNSSPLELNGKIQNRKHILKELEYKFSPKSPVITIYQFKNSPEVKSNFHKLDKTNLEKKFCNKLIKKNLNIKKSNILTKSNLISHSNMIKEIKKLDKSSTESSHSDKLSFEF